MKSILLLICILLLSFCVSAQDFTELKTNEVLFRIRKNDSKRNEVIRTSDSSLLKPGFYKEISDNRVVLFQVNDSGYLIGSLKKYDKEKLFYETLWQDGTQTREFIYLEGRIVMESFDSTVTVMLYDSIKNEWRPQQKKVTVEKEFYKKNQEVRISFKKGGYNSYAHYFYQSGKFTREIIPHYFEKKYDTSGNIILLVQYNWKSKQIETSTFDNQRIVLKNILKNKNIVWDSKGIVQYPDNESLGIERTDITYYSSGKIKKKEVIKNGKRIAIDYDLTGKIKNQTTYKMTEQGGKSIAVPPVEVKQ
jgi:hypothetical protein